MIEQFLGVYGNSGGREVTLRARAPTQTCPDGGFATTPRPGYHQAANSQLIAVPD